MAKSVAHSRQQDKDIKDLATEIHLGLHTLTKIHKTTPEFEKCFEMGMFNKSNPAAFPHVMHFLMYNLDPGEFTSRFYWPLHDKTVEKEFRQSCVKYINELIKRYRMDMEDVGNYIVVVPGGLKFMKVLLELIKLLQVETLKAHNKLEWLELPTDTIFDSALRSHLKTEFDTLHRVHQEFSQATQKELKTYGKKNDMLKYYLKTLENHIKETSDDGREGVIRSEVDEICGKMNQVVRLVADLEKTCGSGPGQHNNPFERIQLSNAISRIVEHHKWMLSSEEYTHKINCASILDVSSRVLQELQKSPISVSEIQPLEVVSQNHEMELFLRNIATIEGDLKLIKCTIKMDQGRHKDHSMAHPKAAVVFPERDYPLPELVEIDLGAIYSELQRKPENSLVESNYRLALEDVIPDPVHLSPPSMKSLNITGDRSLPSSAWPSTSRKQFTTAKKRTKAMSVLKTISRPNKRSKINVHALKELAKSGFNDSIMNSSNITMKKLSLTLNTSKAETSASESMKPPGIRLSGIFSESMMPKFMPNSTSIFNSTTNEQALKLQTSAVLGDVTNKDPLPPQENKIEEKSLVNQFQKIAKGEGQENLLDCSDSILMD